MVRLVIGIVLLMFVMISSIGNFILTDPVESLSHEGASVGMVILSLMLISGGALVLFGARSVARKRKARDLQAKEKTMDEEKIATYKLYSPIQIGVITYIATPMAGPILLAVSFGRLGRTGAAQRAMFWGGISTIALAVLALVIPPNIPKSLMYFMPVVHTYIMSWIVNETYREDYENHILRIGERGPNWHVAGIGLLCLAGFFFITFILSLFILYPH